MEGTGCRGRYGHESPTLIRELYFISEGWSDVRNRGGGGGRISCKEVGDLPAAVCRQISRHSFRWSIWLLLGWGMGDGAGSVSAGGREDE